MWTQIVSFFVADLSISSSKNKSENCPIVCLSIVRWASDMFNLHDKDAVSTQKHLGSKRTSLGQTIASQTLKTVYWLWFERNKNDVNKLTLFRELYWMFKPETSHFHRCITRGNMHRGKSARWGDVKTDLCNRELSCGTHQTHDNVELRKEFTDNVAVYGVRLRKQILTELDVRIGKIYHWTDSSTVLQWLQAAHKKKQVFVANRAAELLENSSMDQWRHVKGVENPADIGTRGMSIEGLKESVWLHGPIWLQRRGDKWPKPWCQENELEPEQVTSTVATVSRLETIQYLRPNWKLHCLLHEV